MLVPKLKSKGVSVLVVAIFGVVLVAFDRPVGIDLVVGLEFDRADEVSVLT